MSDPRAAEREAAAHAFMVARLSKFGPVTWCHPNADNLEHGSDCVALLALLTTRERDAAVGALREAERLITAEHLEDPDKGSEYDLAYDHAVGDCLEAVSARRLALEQGTPATREETP